MNFLKRLFGKKEKPVTKQPISNNGYGVYRGIGYSSGTNYAYHPSSDDPIITGIDFDIYIPPTGTSHDSPPLSFGGFDGGDTGGGGASDSYNDSSDSSSYSNAGD